MTTSLKIYFTLILVVALLAPSQLYLPMGTLALDLEDQSLPASKPVMALASFGIVLVLYGSLGLLGIVLSRKLGFAELWDDRVSNRQRFLVPAVVGIAVGATLVIGDAIFSQFHSFGPIPHPPFPTSIVASVSAGIGEEVLFRLFFISFWVWLLSYVVLKNRYQYHVFWIVAFFSALAFGAAHIPAIALAMGFKNMADIPPVLIIEIILLSGVVAIPCAYYFREFGFLAAVGIHFWADVVWHVICT